LLASLPLAEELLELLELEDDELLTDDELFDAPLVIPEVVGVGADVFPTKLPVVLVLLEAGAVLVLVEPVVLLDVLAPALMPLCTLDPLAGEIVVPLNEAVPDGVETFAIVTPADAFTVDALLVVAELDELLAEVPLPAGTLPPATNVPGLPAITFAGLAFVADALFAFAVMFPPQLVIVTSA
jgi:hypothetical protein